MGSLQIEPRTEIEVREWFASCLDEFPYDVIESRTEFPDYTLRDVAGKTVRAEAEFESANFVRHGHDPYGCELVICWIHTSNLPLPVLELSTGTLHAAHEGAKKGPITPGLRKGPHFSARTLAKCAEEVDQFNAMYAAYLMAQEEAARLYHTHLQRPIASLMAALELLKRKLRKSGGAHLLRRMEHLSINDFWYLLNQDRL